MELWGLTVATLIFRRGGRRVDSWRSKGVVLVRYLFFGVFPLAETEAVTAWLGDVLPVLVSSSHLNE